jgi:hypothetical protein
MHVYTYDNNSVSNSHSVRLALPNRYFSTSMVSPHLQHCRRSMSSFFLNFHGRELRRRERRWCQNVTTGHNIVGVSQIAAKFFAAASWMDPNVSLRFNMQSKSYTMTGANTSCGRPEKARFNVRNRTTDVDLLSFNVRSLQKSTTTFHFMKRRTNDSHLLDHGKCRLHTTTTTNSDIPLAGDGDTIAKKSWHAPHQPYETELVTISTAPSMIASLHPTVRSVLFRDEIHNQFKDVHNSNVDTTVWYNHDE